MFNSNNLQFWGFTKDLHELFYGLAAEDKPCYAQGTGKIDGLPVFLEFVATETFLTVMVSYGASRQDMMPFELTLDTESVEEAMMIARAIEWGDVNTMFLTNERGFDLILTGHFATQKAINHEPLKGVTVEVVWLDIEDGTGEVVEIGEVINQALSHDKLRDDPLFYDFKFNNRQCLVIADRGGLSNIQLRVLVKRWISEGGVV